MPYMSKQSSVWCHRLSAFIVMMSVSTVVFVSSGAVIEQPTSPFPTRFGTNDRAPDFSVFEDLARNGAAFYKIVTGDFNGDGTADLLITNSLAPGSSQNGAGRAYLILGRQSLASLGSINLKNQQPDLTILGPQQLSSLGYTAAAGDLNGDGVDDIVLSAINVRALGRTTWAIYVIFGAREFTTHTIDLAQRSADVAIYGQISKGISPGLAVGDLNHDGARDLIFGTAGDGPGGVSALLGPFLTGRIVDLASESPDVVMTGRGVLDGFGFGVDIADVNGDGMSDLVIGSPGIGRDQGTGAGVVDVFMGSSQYVKGTTISLSQTHADVIILGAFGGSDAGDSLGRLIWSGDVNGDGIDDILLGVPGSTRLDNGLGRTSAGEIYVIFGSPSLVGRVIDVRADQQDLTIQGAAATVQVNSPEWGDSLGSSIAVRDIDGDGLTDILIGASGAGGTKDPGHAYVVLGSTELISGTLLKTAEGDEDIAIEGLEKFAHLGIVVASGDLNGDGNSDIILEAQDAETPGGSQQGTGAIYVYFGGKVRPPDITKAKFKEGKSQLLISGGEFTGDMRVEINGVIINRDVTFLPDEGQLIVRGTRQELKLGSNPNQVVVLRKGTRSNAARVKG